MMGALLSGFIGLGGVVAGVLIQQTWHWWRHERPIKMHGDDVVDIDSRISAHPDNAIAALDRILDTLHPEDEVSVWLEVRLLQGWEGIESRKFSHGPLHGSPESLKTTVRSILLDLDGPLTVSSDKPMRRQSAKTHPVLFAIPHREKVQLYWADSDSPITLRLHGALRRPDVRLPEFYKAVGEVEKTLQNAKLQAPRRERRWER